MSDGQTADGSVLGDIEASFLRSRIKFDTVGQEIRRLLDANRDPSVPHQSIYAVTYRLKGPERLKEKVLKKLADGVPVTADDYPTFVTDLVGARIIGYRISDLDRIAEFLESLRAEDRLVFEQGPDRRQSFVLPVDPGVPNEQPVKLEQSGYSSIHYLVRLGDRTGVSQELQDVVAELQVRTLLEEAWGELDHKYRYEFRRVGHALPDRIDQGFYSFAAYLAAAALHVEYLCQDVEKSIASPSTDADGPASKELEPADQENQFGAEVEGIISYRPSSRALRYAIELMGDGPAATSKLKSAVGDYTTVYRDIVDRDPFASTAAADSDFGLLAQFAADLQALGGEVAASRLRSTLATRFGMPPGGGLLPLGIVLSGPVAAAVIRNGAAIWDGASPDAGLDPSVASGIVALRQMMLMLTRLGLPVGVARSDLPAELLHDSWIEQMEEYWDRARRDYAISPRSSGIPAAESLAARASVPSIVDAYTAGAGVLVLEQSRTLETELLAEARGLGLELLKAGEVLDRLGRS